MKSQPLILRSTSRPLEKVCRRLPDVAQSHHFGLLGTHDLKQKITSKGIPFERECRVFEVCSPKQAQAMLAHRIEIATALPCRIAVYEEAGKTILATIRPTALLVFFNVPDAIGIAQTVEDALILIMDEVATET
jgi:uncharacterized protein (DUF302 family)